MLKKCGKILQDLGLTAALHLHTGTSVETREEEIKPVDGDVILVGDCARHLPERFPGAKYSGSSEEFPNCTPIHANIPARSIANYIASLVEISR